MQISVIVPAHNSEKYLGEALSSVLNQSYPVDEILVVDDGSTDGTAEVVKKFQQVRYVRQVKAGAAAARNTGIAKTRGEILAFLDSDDLWTPEKIELQVEALSLRDDIVFGRVKEFLSPELDAATHPYQVREETMLGKLPSALLARRRVFQLAGQFSTEWAVGEFIEWYSRATDSGFHTQALEQLVTLRRIHKTNQGITKPHKRQDFAKLLGAVLRRRRETLNDEET